MVSCKLAELDSIRQKCDYLSSAIQHLNTIPTAAFPNVEREVREEARQQGQQEEAGQKEAQTGAEQVKPARRTGFNSAQKR